MDSTGVWRLLSDPAPAPPTFSIPLGAYDPIRHRTLVIENEALGDAVPTVVHVLSRDGGPHWSILATLGTPPTARYLGAMVYDPPRDRMLLFGGLDQNEVWALDLAGTPEWQKLSTRGPLPDARTGASLVYDPAGDRVIVFGGNDDYSGSNHTYLDDTWALSLATNQWSLLQPQGDPPPPREGHAAIYDPVGHRMVVFGGHFSTGFLDDVWTLSLGDTTAWTELQPAGDSPNARSACGAIYDPVRRLMWIHSGVRADGSVEPDDLWSLSLSGPPTWSAAALASSLPGKSYPVDVYDPERDELLMCGAGWLAQSAALPLAGPFAWTAFLPIQPPPEPGPRSAPLVLYDSRRDLFLALGGSYGSTDWDQWSLAPGAPARWTARSRAVTPDVWEQAAVYDSSADQLVAFDGGDAWTYSSRTDSLWQRVAASGPRYTSGASIALDSRRHRLLVYGGDIFEPHGDGGTISDLWALSLDQPPTWTLLGQGPSPGGSAEQRMFYDAAGDRLVIMGGYSRSGNSRRYAFGAVVWASPLGSPLDWTSLTSITLGAQPPAPPATQLSFDARRNRLLVFADTLAWIRSLDDTGPWMSLAAPSPRPSVSGPVVFDPVRDQLVALFAASAGEPPAQAWALSFGAPATTLLGATALFYRVDLSWHSGESVNRPVTVERRDAASTWAPIANIAFNGLGDAAFSDAHVVPSSRYAYRLTFLQGGVETSTDSVWVNVPARAPLALAAPRPNPSPGVFQASFTLPSEGSARLDLYDIRGSRVLGREVGSLGPGTHVVELGTSRPLTPGVYLLRLTRGGETRNSRLVVVR